MNNLTKFLTTECTVSLWVFKSSKRRAFSVPLGNELIKKFKEIKPNCLADIKNYVAYDSGAATAKDTAMVIEGDIDQWTKILELISAPVEDRHVRSISGLQNNFAYVVVFSIDNKKLYAVKKVSSSLGSKKSNNFFDSLFSGGKLEIAENLIFSISNTFDFFYIEEKFYILNRSNFESILGYKEQYKKNFQDLIDDQEFNSKISKTEIIAAYVGENAIQLGRMSAIKEKRKFADQVYWQSVIDLNQQEEWGIEVSPNGQIVVSEDKVKDIISILLGHRVKSLCNREISDASGLMLIKR